MYYTIRIIDGDFKIYNDFNHKFYSIEDPKVTKENLKKKILEVINSEIEPLRVRSLIYKALTLISGYETKHPCKYVLTQEQNDPLYKELSDWVLDLDEYHELIKTSKKLKVGINDFVVYDINGIISTTLNEDIDFNEIESKFNLLIADKTNRRHSTNRILKDVLSEYFGVYYCSLCLTNPLVEKWLERISSLDIKKEVVFKDGKILIRIKKEYFTPESNVTIDALKKLIIQFIKKHNHNINKSDIIFSSLEELTKLKVVRAIPKYVTTYVGENKMKKDVLVQDPLYLELCDFIESLPEYQENKHKLLESNEKRLQNKRQNMILVREQKFVDTNFTFSGTYLPPRRYHR